MNFWDERYRAADGYVFGTAPNDFLAAHAASIPPGPVLCLAEGEGRNAVFLAQRGHAVTAVDQSTVGLAKARQLAAQHGVTITTAQCRPGLRIPAFGRHWRGNPPILHGQIDRSSFRPARTEPPAEPRARREP